MVNRKSVIRKRAQAVRRQTLDFWRAGARFAVSPIYQSLLRHAVLRKVLSLLFRLFPGLDRLAIRFLVRIGFYPAIAAETATTGPKSLLDGGHDFTQSTKPSLSAREQFFKRDLASPTGLAKKRDVRP